MKKIFLVLWICFAYKFTICQPLSRHEFARQDSLFTEYFEIDLNKSIKASLVQIQIAHKLQNDSLLAVALVNKGKALDELGIFDEALKAQYAALKILDTSTFYHTRFEANFSIGETHFSLDDYKTALTFYRRAKEAAILSKEAKDSLRASLEIGLNLVATDKVNEGITLLHQTLQTAEQLHLNDLLFIGYDNLSNVYYELNDIAKAIQYQLKSHEYIEGQNTFANLTGKNEHLALLYFESGDIACAKTYADSALYYAQKWNNPDWLFECYRDLGNISEAKGQYKEALGYFKQHLIYKDSVFKKQYDVKMSAMNTLYELNTKETKISNLELQKKLQQEKIKELYILIAFIVLLLIIIILLIHRRNHRNEKKLREFFTEQQLKSQEDERQRISKDLHDSVGQNMLFIKNQLLQLQQPIPDLVMTSVEQALQEIRSISKELYPNQLDQYGLQSAVDVLCEKVRASSHVFISSELNIDRSEMNKELKINCYRIIQESITNALKHAAASAIRITGERIGNTLEFIVQDNGKGFDESIRSKLIHRSFGLLNIEERVRIMHGQLDIETGLNKGTKLKFQIPIV